MSTQEGASQREGHDNDTFVCTLLKVTSVQMVGFLQDKAFHNANHIDDAGAVRKVLTGHQEPLCYAA